MQATIISGCGPCGGGQFRCGFASGGGTCRGGVPGAGGVAGPDLGGQDLWACPCMCEVERRPQLPLCAPRAKAGLAAPPSSTATSTRTRDKTRGKRRMVTLPRWRAIRAVERIERIERRASTARPTTSSLTPSAGERIGAVRLRSGGRTQTSLSNAEHLLAVTMAENPLPPRSPFCVDTPDIIHNQTAREGR